MIHEERDPAFWVKVASHPEVRGTLFGLDPEEIGVISQDASVLPLATAHGGFLFAETGPLNCMYDLHALYTPDGWGGEVWAALKSALELVFARCQAVTVLEVEANSKSRPPLSYGFRQAHAEYRATDNFGRARLWVLTRAAWERSPARKRM